MIALATAGLARRALGVLGAVPLWAWAAAALAGVTVWQTHEARVARADRVAAIEARDDAVHRADDMAAAMVETNRRLAAQEGVIRDARATSERNRVAAAAAAAAADRLRDHVVALATRASDPGPADGGPSAADAARMLAELQRRADERAGVLARIADERGAAGDACVRLYESLTR